jgi:hypothetical protein
LYEFTDSVGFVVVVGICVVADDEPFMYEEVLVIEAVGE